MVEYNLDLDTFGDKVKTAAFDANLERQVADAAPESVVRDINNYSEIDLGDPEPVAEPVAALEVPEDQSLSALGQLTPAREPNLRPWIYAGLLAITVIIASVQLTSDDSDLADVIRDALIDLGIMDKPEPIVTAPKVVAVPTIPAPDPEPPQPMLSAESVDPWSHEAFANPYWYLSPSLAQDIASKNEPRRILSHAQEQLYRAGMNHAYNYQVYKTVREIRRDKFSGAEVLLFEALNQKRFWTRMEALIGLAEYHVAVDQETVEAALIGARPSLIKNYFKRLAVSHSDGSIYIAKLALPLVEARARLVILQGLSKIGWRGHRLYLAAAVYDKSPLVQKWLQSELEVHPLTGAHMLAYREIVVQNYLRSQSKDLTPGKIELTEPASRFGVKDHLTIYKEVKPPTPDNLDTVFTNSTAGSDDGFEEINGFTTTPTDEPIVITIPKK